VLWRRRHPPAGSSVGSGSFLSCVAHSTRRRAVADGCCAKIRRVVAKVDLVEHPISTLMGSRSENCRKLKPISDPHIRKCYITCRSRILEKLAGNKTGKIYSNCRVQVQCPSKFEVDLVSHISRSAATGRPQ
jgi:hypothetical protein